MMWIAQRAQDHCGSAPSVTLEHGRRGLAEGEWAGYWVMNADMSDWGAGMHGRRTQPRRLEEVWEFELDGEEEEEDKSWWCV